LLIVFPLTVQQTLEFGVLGISLDLDGIKFLLQPGLSLECLLESLLKRALLAHLALVEEFILFEKCLFLAFKLLVARL
jgi:hypothetical protein